MSKVFRQVSVCICGLLVLLLLALSACSAGTGYINTLDLLVSSKIIGESDLKNIAAIRNGSLQRVIDEQADPLELETVEYTATPVSDQLSDEQTKDILNDFKKFVDDRYEAAHADYRVSDSKIVDYYGTYGGHIVVEIEFSMTGLDLSSTATDHLIISGYYLGGIGENSLIVCWTPNS